jgi:hypothetical protein
MLKIKLATALCVLMIASTTASISCSREKGGDAIDPGVNNQRNAEVFSEAGKVFPEGTGTETFQSVDLATIKDSNSDSAASINVGGSNHFLTALVTMEKYTTGSPSYTVEIPYIAWLKDTTEGSPADVYFRYQFASAGGALLNYRCPHVAAWKDDEYINAAVSFEWQYKYGGTWTSWCPGVWFMRWLITDLDSTPPTTPSAYSYYLDFFPVGYPGGTMQTYGQDIAWNPGDNSLTLLFCMYDSGYTQDTYKVRPEYLRLTEDYDSFDFTPTSIWRAYQDVDINCFTPCIDIGKYELTEIGGLSWVVAIAFTAQHYPAGGGIYPSPYCVAGNAWYASETGNHESANNNVFYPGTYTGDPVNDPDNVLYYSCGEPSLDFGPLNMDQDPWIAMSFLQEVVGWWDYDVMFMDSVNATPVRLQVPNTTDERKRFGGSVTCIDSTGDRKASISSYADYGTENYRVCAASFDIDDWSSSTWNDYYTTVSYNAPNISGTFSMLDYLNTNPGISTAISSWDTAGNYYLAYSTNVSLTTPSEIWAACGNTSD